MTLCAGAPGASQCVVRPATRAFDGQLQGGSSGEEFAALAAADLRGLFSRLHFVECPCLRPGFPPVSVFAPVLGQPQADTLRTAAIRPWGRGPAFSVPCRAGGGVCRAPATAENIYLPRIAHACRISR